MVTRTGYPVVIVVVIKDVEAQPGVITPVEKDDIISRALFITGAK
jgi:hypothetical protein